MDAIRKVLRKFRGTRVRHPKPETSVEKAIALWRAQKYSEAFWERDKKIVRDANFRKAQLVRNDNLERRRLEREAEAERQSEIAEIRTKNLRKARRKLRWIRSQNG